jgi:hypothetical protein
MTTFGGWGPELDRSALDVRQQVEAMMDAHWRADGYTVPNADVYPWQWLWDSCFHALVWAELGRADRAVAELQSVLSDQDASGFVPHVRYVDRPEHLSRFWGRPATSSITQPPMYGHAVAELIRRGVEVPDDLLDRAERGLRFLLDRRARTPDGVITVVHPWETGCDDSPRWDHWCLPTWDTARWYDVKGELLDGVERSRSGAPLANPSFGAGSIGFSALVAWNAAELASVTGDRALATSGLAVAHAVEARWDAALGTWVDAGPSAGTSGRVRTLDALLGALLPGDHAAEALEQAVDDDAFGGRFGPPAVHRAEPSYAPGTYWRGSAWPQLTYLLWCAARRSGLDAVADGLADRLVAGAVTSGLAEHWNPDTGAPLGAAPQSWSGLALLVG